MSERSRLLIKKITPLVFALCVLVMFAYSFWFLLIREPIGDDVMGLFDKGISFYLDEMDDTIGERITTVPQAFGAVKLLYTKWSGRIVGYAFNEINGLLSSTIKAVIGACILNGNVLLMLVIAYGSLKKASFHPLMYTVLFLAMYWYRPLGFYEYMWTMISVYEIPLMACLIFCTYLLRNGYEEKQIGTAIFLGLIAGASNEVCVALTIALLGIRWLYGIAKKEFDLNSLTYYIGLFVGTLLCVLAPGNFNRMRQSHDDVLKSTPIALRVKNSIGAHKDMLISGNTALRIMITIILVTALALTVRFVIKYGREGIAYIWREIYPFVVAGVASIAVWGVMPRTPAYGLSFWIGLVYIAIAKVIRITLPHKVNEKGLVEILSGCLGLALIISFLLGNTGWLIRHMEYTEHRMQLIKEAASEGKEEILIPAYPDDAIGPIVEQGCLNEQEQYDADHYLAYYGIHIIIEK